MSERIGLTAAPVVSIHLRLSVPQMDLPPFGVVLKLMRAENPYTATLYYRYPIHGGLGGKYH